MDEPVRLGLGLRSLTRGAVLVCVTLAGCAALDAGYGPGPLRPGDGVQAVVARMGQPTERLPRAGGGERLVYARGPQGVHTWMIDVGTDGRVQVIDQVLTMANFARIQPGMSEAQLRALIGPPSEQRALAIEQRRLLAWRFPTYDCLWYAVTLNALGRVLDAGTMTDPRCDVDHD